MTLLNKLKNGVIAGAIALSACAISKSEVKNPVNKNLVDNIGFPKLEASQSCLEYSLDTTEYRLAPLLRAVNTINEANMVNVADNAADSIDYSSTIPLTLLNKGKCDSVSIKEVKGLDYNPVRIDTLVCPDLYNSHDEFGKKLYYPFVLHIEGSDFKIKLKGKSSGNEFSYCLQEGSSFNQNLDNKIVLQKARDVLDNLYRAVER